MTNVASIESVCGPAAMRTYFAYKSADLNFDMATRSPAVTRRLLFHFQVMRS